MMLRMETGVADVEQARWWEAAAVHQFTEHSPLGDLHVVSNQSTNKGCDTALLPFHHARAAHARAHTLLCGNTSTPICNAQES